MNTNLIDWNTYRQDLKSNLANERIWELGASNDIAANCHAQNAEMIKNELNLIELKRYSEVVALHADNSEHWDDYLLLACPHCGSNDVYVKDHNDDNWDPLYACHFCENEFTINQ